MTFANRGVTFATLLLASSTASLGGTTVSLVGIGHLPSSSPTSDINALSADGSTVVGWSKSVEGIEAIRWRNGILRSLGDFPGGGGVNSCAYSVSGDGSVVGGQGSDTYNVGSSWINFEPAFIWTESTGLQNPLGPRNGQTTCISQDGSICAASTTYGGWHSTFGSLCSNAWNEWGTITCMSRDGSACFGRMFAFEAQPAYGGACYGANRISVDKLTGRFRWGGSISDTPAQLCSADGSKALFRFIDGVYLWSSTTPTLLPQTTNFDPYAANSDLSELYGVAPINGVSQAAVWTLREGVRTLREFVLQKFGVDLPNSGRTLTSCKGVSNNGLVIAGSGTNSSGNQEGWVLRVNYDWNNNGIDDAQEIKDGLIGDVNNDGIADCYQSGIDCPGPNIAANPGFEAGSVLVDCTSELLTAGTSTGSWQVVSGVAERANRSKTCLGGNWAAEFGAYAIELRSTGGGPGTIRQAITTEPGRHYRVSFWMSANCTSGGTVSVRASAGNSSKIFTRTCEGTGKQSWLRCEFDFVAGLTTETLAFASENQPSSGPVIDAISVSDVTVGCPSDLDGNGQVDTADVGLLLLNFGPCQ